jgi:hypothetical protein
MTAHPLLLNAALIIVMTFALDWRESRWTRRPPPTAAPPILASFGAGGAA